MTVTHSENDLVFASAALETDALYLHAMTGHEALSRLFEFDVMVQTTAPEPIEQSDVDAMLQQPAYLAFGPEEQHKIHGVIRAVEMQSMSEPGAVMYRIALVPALWWTTLTVRSKVFQDKTVPEIITDVLKDHGMQEDTDFELHMSAKHPTREFTVQYQESDFDFISRLMEYEGIFYFFDHGEAAAKVIIADANRAFVELEGHATIPYDPRSGITNTTEAIHSMTSAQNALTKKLSVRDYNYRTPSVAMVADAKIDDNGRGQHVYYGEHFKDVSDGKRIAKIRAEEHLVSQHRYECESRVRGLRVGHKYTLEGHLLSVFDAEYYVAETFHSASQSGTAGGADATGGNQGYSNRFTALPNVVPFRPTRFTPKPRISGVMHAKIDAASSGTAAPIDDHGRYKVVLPYDVGGKAGGKASRWIRMAQNYSGPGYGSHFPLHAGAEVILVHVDGDPDRPIIAATVPNPEMATPVSSGNATQSVIRSHAGIHIEFEDDA